VLLVPQSSDFVLWGYAKKDAIFVPPLAKISVNWNAE
jgi:hypothetical protein